MVLEKRLLCISDLEGCQGAEALCKKESYDTIIKYLDDDKMENHIVFLGDYFDQGPHMIESINGIGNVIDKFGPDTRNHRAHIILGNRDINKLRILYDALSDLEQPSKENTWSTWQDYLCNAKNELKPGYIIYNETTNTSTDPGTISRSNADFLKTFRNEDNTIFDKKNDDDDFKIKKMRTILACTYGAANLLQNIITEVKTLGEDITELDAIYIIGSIFMDYKEDIIKNHPILENENITAFKQNCRKIFYYGKLISNFNIEGFGNVLMSHGGSYSPYIFNLNSKYYKQIMDEVTIVAKPDEVMMDAKPDEVTMDAKSKYFEIMETFRKKFAENIFAKPETEINNILDFHMKEINSIYTDFINQLYKKNMDGTIETNLDYIDAINKGIKGNFDFAKKFYILQSLGLNSGTGEKGFVSPIASCGMNAGCGPLNNNNETEILDLFKSLNIKYVVNGHIPHCSSVPIIYKRKLGPNNIVFVNNDTSVGYTQEKNILTREKDKPDKFSKGQIHHIPLAYLTSKNVGITALTLNGVLDKSKIITGYDVIDPKTKNIIKKYNYDLLVDDWEYNNTPYVNAKNIESDKFILELNGKRLPLTITGKPKKGGKSRRRRRKSGRVSKRRHKKMCKNMHCKRCG